MTFPSAAPSGRSARGKRAQRRGLDAEAVACAALQADGWTVLGQRLRTAAGEIDVVARRDSLLAFVEVKARSTLSDAAYALSARQQRRLLLAAEIERARIRGELYDDVDPYDSAAFFLIGVHGQLISAGVPGSGRDEVLKKFVTSTLRSLQR